MGKNKQPRRWRKLVW